MRPDFPTEGCGNIYHVAQHVDHSQSWCFQFEIVMKLAVARLYDYVMITAKTCLLSAGVSHFVGIPCPASLLGEEQ